MTTTAPTIPDEETPLLCCKQVSAPGEITECEPEAVTLAGPSNKTSRTPSIKSKTNADGGPDVVKRTPLPWTQFSITLFLQLAEPLTSQVISPVSSPVRFSVSFYSGIFSHRPKGFDWLLNDPSSLLFVVCTRGQSGKLRTFVGSTS